MHIIDHGTAGPIRQRILRTVRRHGTISREELADITGLSMSTISRALQAMLDARLIHPRPDLTPSGPRGRPSVPIQLNLRDHLVAGICLTQSSVSVVVADLQGHALQSRTFECSGDDVVRWAAQVSHVLDEIVPAGRRVLGAGVVAESHDLVPDTDDVFEIGEILGVPASAADLTHAGALTEHLLAGQGQPGKTVYFHASDAVGYVVVIEDEHRTVINDATDLSHFPTSSSVVCSCLRTGCLAAAASGRAVAHRAQVAGIIDRPNLMSLHQAAQRSCPLAQRLLRDRARVLGEAAAVIRDMVRHDTVTFIGAGAVDPGTRSDLLARYYDLSTKSPQSDRVGFGYLGHELAPAAASTLATELLLQSDFLLTDRGMRVALAE